MSKKFKVISEQDLEIIGLGSDCDCSDCDCSSDCSSDCTYDCGCSGGGGGDCGCSGGGSYDCTCNGGGTDVAILFPDQPAVDTCCDTGLV